MLPLFLPSPAISGFSVGSLRFHFAALFLIAGIVVGWFIAIRRWRDRGGDPLQFETIVMWTIPIGIVGARLFYVLTHLSEFTGPDVDPFSPLYLWEGGLSIEGALIAGILAVWIASRQVTVRFSTVADCLVPGLAIGQAIGRWGDWFNQEYFGQPSTVPWAVEIAPSFRPDGYADAATYHPLFLYESLWLLLTAGFLLLLDRLLKLGHGKVFALYLLLFGLGRSATETLRLTGDALKVGPVALTMVVALAVAIVGLILTAWLFATRPGRERTVWLVQPVAPDEVQLEDIVAARLDVYNNPKGAARAFVWLPDIPMEESPATPESAPEAESAAGATWVATTVRASRRRPPAPVRGRVADGRRDGTGTLRLVEVPLRERRSSGTVRRAVRVLRPDPTLRRRAAVRS